MANVDTETLVKIVDGINSEPNGYYGIEHINWNGLEVEINKTLDFKEAMTFVDNIVSLVYDKESISYMPELKDIAIRRSVIDLYTNIELPNDINECHRILYETNLFEFVIGKINGRQFNMLIASANDKLEYITQSNIDAINRKFGELISVFEDIASKFEGVDTDKMQAALDGLQKLGMDANSVIGGND